jgi:hypothetical protein
VIPIVGQPYAAGVSGKYLAGSADASDRSTVTLTRTRDLDGNGATAPAILGSWWSGTASAALDNFSVELAR